MGKKKKKNLGKSDIGGGSAYGEYKPKDWERITGPKQPKAKREVNPVNIV
tara:strand:+ start:536 stop:685 length:150 start_codon:yes stop_codon:yes gene_type:complete